jgi:hypothetical protein
MEIDVDMVRKIPANAAAVKRKLFERSNEKQRRSKNSWGARETACAAARLFLL